MNEVPHFDWRNHSGLWSSVKGYFESNFMFADFGAHRHAVQWNIARVLINIKLQTPKMDILQVCLSNVLENCM